MSRYIPILKFDFPHSFVLNNLDKKISFIFKLPCRLHWERFTLNFLGATLKRGFTYSRIFYFVCIYVSQSRASLIKVTSLNEVDMLSWKNNLYGKTLARQKNTNELIFAKPSAIRHFKK